MHATRTGNFTLHHLFFFHTLRGMGLALPLFVGFVPGMQAEEPVGQVHAPAIPPTDSGSQTSVGQPPASPQAPVSGTQMRTSGSATSRSTITGPDSASLEISRSVPFLNKITDVNLFTGVYEFDEGPDDSFTGVRAGVDFALTNRIRVEASYNQDQDLNRNNGFVGLWASIPLGKPDSNDSSGNPSRTLADSIIGEAPPTRNRTNRKPSDSRSREGSGLLGRIFGGSTEAESSSVPEKAPSRGPLRDLLARLRK